MAVAVGIDVASHAVGNTPQAIEGLIAKIRAAESDHGPAIVGIDVLGGGIAALAEAMLLAEGLAVVHVPGLAVNRARRGTAGGEHKSGPQEAQVIAGQARRRDDLRAVTAMREDDVELRLLTGRRAEIVAGQARRASRLGGLLVPVFPGLEGVVDVTTKTGLHLLTRYVPPAGIRRAGRAGLTAWLRRTGRVKDAAIDALAQAAMQAAQAQQVTVPGEAVTAELIRGLAAGALAGRDQLAAIGKRTKAVLARHPDASAA